MLCHTGLTQRFQFLTSGCSGARMYKKLKNGVLDQYCAMPFEQQQFGPADIEEVNCQER